jgi:tRNA uridine 5-carboxymethylaminomethyl modification enzyme
MYVNGLSTSLPPAVQLEYLRSVPGLEHVEMTRPGYAIEYDYFPPTQLDHSLKVKSLNGLYFAGQINGTTGYEEAAGQGVVAGLNAAAWVQNRPPIRLRRDESMIGVLVDDLVTRGVDEPYRLFTSRAEFRLLLRQDNALRRLYPLANRLGLLSEEEQSRAEERLLAEERVLDLARTSMIWPKHVNRLLETLGQRPIDGPVPAADLARRPGVSLRAVLASVEVDVDEQQSGWADIELRYEGYLAREAAAARRLGAMDQFVLPPELEYLTLKTISYEAREKLHRVRPDCLGQAARIPGVSPSDLQSLLMEVVRSRPRQRHE